MASRHFVTASRSLVWTGVRRSGGTPYSGVEAGSVQSRVARAVHLAHAAGSERCDDFIRTEACAAGEGQTYFPTFIGVPVGAQQPRRRPCPAARRAALARHVTARA